MVTTGQIAKHCRVTHKTVSNWIKRGALRAYTTPGRHYRVRVQDLQRFLVASGLPAYPDADAGTGPQRMLIVDDDESIVKVIERTMQGAGFAVSTAFNGFNAGLEVARFKPDVILLDLMMPYVDGFEVCRDVKEDPATTHVKVLIMTGYAEPGFQAQAFDCGADSLIEKPFQLPALLERVQQLLEVHEQR